MHLVNLVQLSYMDIVPTITSEIPEPGLQTLFLNKTDLPMSIKSNWPTHAQLKKHAGPVVVSPYPA